MAVITIQGVEYTQFLADIRAMLQQSDISVASAVAPQVGGIELAEEITGLSRSRIYTLVSERGLPHSKRGNKLYFNRADLLAWVEAGTRVEK